ncbi:MAG: S10 family serine carboxypeptidase-like protein, partial [Candidatus Saccharimonadales bacterium]
MKIIYLLLILSYIGYQPAAAQKHHSDKRFSRNDTAATAGTNDTVSPPVVTHHNITLDGKTINYTASAGYMPIKDKYGKLLARIFYVAYTADGQQAGKRPITFAFNGGPGSSSIWLHMGAISPVRVHFADDSGNAPAPPYTYGENENSWLSFTDLVFIDPVSTGYSRTVKGVKPADYHGYSQDIASVG